MPPPAWELPPVSERDRTAADRQREKRRRDRQGLRPYRIDLPEGRVAEVLIDAGLLTDAGAVDHRVTERALENFISYYILCHTVTSGLPGSSATTSPCDLEMLECSTEREL
jgi:hypothetical protein